MFKRVVLYEFVLLTECGLAPSVTLDCTDGSAHVDWVASRPGCQFDCKGYWNCTNITNYYEETVTIVSYLILCSYRDLPGG